MTAEHDPASVMVCYDRLADDYHLIFADWRAGVRRQGQVLDALIRDQLGDGARTMLDCTCGIGTQAIGLALAGHLVHGTDLSPRAVERAVSEAASFGVSLTTGVADVRRLEAAVAGTFEVVLSCDNSLAHLLTEAELRLAVRNMVAKLAPGGLLLISLRDYDAILTEKPTATLPQRAERDGERHISFQLWTWLDDGASYRFELFTLRERDGEWTIGRYEATLRAIQRTELTAAIEATRCTDVRWHAPEESGYYQPIVTARRPA